jgi:hypothetical protein
MATLNADLNLVLAVQRTNQTYNLMRDELPMLDQAFNEGLQQAVIVAKDTDDQVISLGPLTTVQMLLMISDQTITPKINSEATGHACKNMLFTGASITTLTLSNESVTLDANVRLIMLGT